MNEKNVQDALLSSKANAAFQQAAKKVLQRARQTGTPIVIWEVVGMPGFIEILQISL